MRGGRGCHRAERAGRPPDRSDGRDGAKTACVRHGEGRPPPARRAEGKRQRRAAFPHARDTRPHPIRSADTPRWAAATAVCDLVEEDIEGLTRPQAHFDIVKQIEPGEASELDKKYGNILILSINPSVEEPTMEVIRNRYAYPQTIVVVSAGNQASATEFITASALDIRDVFETARRKQSNNYYAGHPADQLIEDFKQHTGLDMLIPANFYKATTRDKELLWYIRDYPNKAQYIFAFSYPYTDADDLTAEWLMRTLDNRLATISSKGAVGSYMGKAFRFRLGAKRLFLCL